MAQQVTNFGRFYTAIRAMGIIGDRDEVKRQLVWQYTNGRTDSLKEMTCQEYDRCCEELERRYGHRELLRKERSATLKLMQRAGIDTTDWNRVNAFCIDPRVAGKEFARLSIDELVQLRRKIRAIDNKGGFTTKTEREAARRQQASRTASSRQIPIIIDKAIIGQA